MENKELGKDVTMTGELIVTTSTYVVEGFKALERFLKNHYSNEDDLQIKSQGKNINDKKEFLVTIINTQNKIFYQDLPF